MRACADRCVLSNSKGKGGRDIMSTLSSQQSSGFETAGAETDEGAPKSPRTLALACCHRPWVLRKRPVALSYRCCSWRVWLVFGLILLLLQLEGVACLSVWQKERSSASA